MVVVIAIRLPTVVEVVDGTDKDNRVAVAQLVEGQGDEADLVPMTVINMASRVTTGKSSHSVHTRYCH